MTIIINDYKGHYTKTWLNWDDRMIPQAGDTLILHFGDNNEVARQAKVIARVFDGTRPDMVYLTTDYERGGEQ
jgi:hypothetical protein